MAISLPVRRPESSWDRQAIEARRRLRVDAQAPHAWRRSSGPHRNKKLKADGVECKMIMDDEDSSQSASPEAIEDLERILAESQAELEHFHCLLNELPCIYEDKFRQKVRTVAQDLRNLFDERNALQAQVSLALAQAQERQALSPALAAELVTPAEGRPEVGLSRFRIPLPVVESVQALRLSWLSLRCHIPRGRLWAWSLAGGFGIALLLIFGRQFLGNQRTASRDGIVATIERSRIPRSAATMLILQARGGQVWVLVESLSGGKVYDAFLDKGESKVLPLGTGLRIRSGRADLLFVSIGSDSPRALGGVSDLDWVEFRP